MSFETACSKGFGRFAKVFPTIEHRIFFSWFWNPSWLLSQHLPGLTYFTISSYAHNISIIDIPTISPFQISIEIPHKESPNRVPDINMGSFPSDMVFSLTRYGNPDGPQTSKVGIGLSIPQRSDGPRSKIMSQSGHQRYGVRECLFKNGRNYIMKKS